MFYMRKAKLLIMILMVLFSACNLGFGWAGGNTLVKIGRPYYMFGPDTHRPDSPFNVVKRTDGQLLGYFGGGNTTVANMDAMWHLTETPTVECLALGNGFDWNGAFLNTVIKTGSSYLGWYHAECGYAPENPNRRYWEVGFCVSYDNWGYGRWYGKPAYPNNVCLQWEFGYHPEFTTPHGEGNLSVVQWGNYFYMIFEDTPYPGEADQRSGSGIARATLASAGQPGYWWKWVNRDGNIGFLGAGNGGVADKPLYGTGVYVQPWASVYTTDNKLCAGPFALMFASDQNNMESWDWAGLNGQFEWLYNEQLGADNDGQEALGYGSMFNPVPSDPDFATNRWNNNGFYAYFMYIPPGISTATSKYLYRGLMHVPVNTQYVSSNNGMPHVWKTLTINYSSSLQDYWSTTAPMVNEGRVGNTTFSGNYNNTKNAVPALDYTPQADLGYVFPNQTWYNLLAVYDLYNTVNKDHWLGLEAEKNQANTIILRKVGYVWSYQYTDSIALYRFRNSNGTKHYSDVNPTPKSGYTLETTLGYIFPIGYNPG